MKKIEKKIKKGLAKLYFKSPTKVQRLIAKQSMKSMMNRKKNQFLDFVKA